MPLARDQHDVARARHPDRLSNRRLAITNLASANRTSHHFGADRRRILAARIVVGHDRHIAKPRRDFAHRPAFAFVAVAAGTEHGDQLALDMRAQCRNRRLERIGGMRIIDIDRRARPADHRAFQPPAHRRHPAHRAKRLVPTTACRQQQPRRGQHIIRLIRADQRQRQLVLLARMAKHQPLPERGRHLLDQCNHFRSGPDGNQLEPPRLRMINHRARPRVAGPHHRRPAVRDNLVEQPHLGGEIGVHVSVIIEVIAAEIGECRRHHRQPFAAILVEAVRRCFVGDMPDPHPLEPRHIAQESDDVGRGQPGLDLLVGGGHAERPDARRSVPGHTPHLPRHLDRRGLAVGPGDRDDHVGIGPVKLARQLSEPPPWLGIGDVHRAVDHSLGPRDHCDRAMLDRPGDELLAIELLAAKRAEDISLGHFAMIDREAGHPSVAVDPREIA